MTEWLDGRRAKRGRLSRRQMSWGVALSFLSGVASGILVGIRAVRSVRRAMNRAREAAMVAAGDAIDAAAEGRVVEEDDLPPSLRRAIDRTRQLMAAVSTDDLTGINSRSFVVRHAFQSVEAAETTHEPVSIALLDVDHFKRVNDRLGHLAGDEVLKGLARKLEQHLLDDELIGRYGGEEFLLVFPPGTDKGVATGRADELRRLIADEPLALPDGSRVPVTISGGVATSGTGNGSLDDILRKADNALYASKDLGRNRVSSFDDNRRAVESFGSSDPGPAVVSGRPDRRSEGGDRRE